MSDPIIPLKDIQLDLNNPGPEDADILANAHRACANCRGFCCLAFQLSFPKYKIPGILARKRREARALIEQQETHIGIMHFYFGREVDWTEQACQQARTLLSEIENLEFFGKNLIPIRLSTKEARKNAKLFRNYTYTCAKFDVAARRCTAYEGRPDICKKYICGPASVGLTPPEKHMLANPNLIEGMDAKYRLQDLVGYKKPKQHYAFCENEKATETKAHSTDSPEKCTEGDHPTLVEAGGNPEPARSSSPHQADDRHREGYLPTQAGDGDRGKGTPGEKPGKCDRRSPLPAAA